MLGKVVLLIEIGAVAGLLFGGLVSWGFLRTAARLDTPPSSLARSITVLLILAFTALLIGPLFSFTFQFLFWRYFGQESFWLYGLIVTIIMGLAANLYAWSSRLRDLRTVIIINLGGACLLGWLIPLLHEVWRR